MNIIIYILSTITLFVSFGVIIFTLVSKKSLRKSYLIHKFEGIVKENTDDLLIKQKNFYDNLYGEMKKKAKSETIRERIKEEHELKTKSLLNLRARYGALNPKFHNRYRIVQILNLFAVGDKNDRPMLEKIANDTNEISEVRAVAKKVAATLYGK